MNKLKRIAALAALALSAVAFTGCMSSADKVSDNLSKEAERFQIVRSIVAVNGITDKVLFEVRGRCSLEYGETMSNTLDLICKDPDGYKKHYIGISDNVTFISTQLKGVNVSEYRTKVIFKPENIIPDLDLQTSANTPD